LTGIFILLYLAGRYLWGNLQELCCHFEPQHEGYGGGGEKSPGINPVPGGFLSRASIEMTGWFFSTCQVPAALANFDLAG